MMHHQKLGFSAIAFGNHFLSPITGTLPKNLTGGN
jgi:hypothetical protein